VRSYETFVVQYQMPERRNWTDVPDLEFVNDLEAARRALVYCRDHNLGRTFQIVRRHITEEVVT
jgi:hypothetical protein